MRAVGDCQDDGRRDRVQGRDDVRLRAQVQNRQSVGRVMATWSSRRSSPTSALARGRMPSSTTRMMAAVTVSPVDAVIVMSRTP